MPFIECPARTIWLHLLHDNSVTLAAPGRHGASKSVRSEAVVGLDIAMGRYGSAVPAAIDVRLAKRVNFGSHPTAGLTVSGAPFIDRRKQRRPTSAMRARLRRRQSAVLTLLGDDGRATTDCSYAFCVIVDGVERGGSDVSAAFVSVATPRGGAHNGGCRGRDPEAVMSVHPPNTLEDEVAS